MLALNSLFVHFSNFLLAIHNTNNNGNKEALRVGSGPSRT